MKHMPSSKFMSLVLFTMLFSCSPTEQISVTNINDSGFRQSGALLYSLPQTVIDVSVQADEQVVIPGPFRPYAEKYLGIRDVPAKPEYSWTVTLVKIGFHAETDPDYVYAVMGAYTPDLFPGLPELVRDSMILDLNRLNYRGVYYDTFPAKSAEPYFTDLSIKRNFEAEKDVEVSKVMPDTVYLTRPASKNNLRNKTLEQKAEEAANFLIKLKKRRFKLVSGQLDSMPQGVALGDALRELSRLEDNYLSLFTGKRTVYHHQRIYHFTPVSGKKTDRIVLFRFSENEGFLDARESKGKPVLLDITNCNKIKGLEQAESPFNTSGNTLLYRIPDQVGLKLLLGEFLLADAYFPVFQSGAMVRMKVTPVIHKKQK
jgi:hypothetical protein